MAQTNDRKPMAQTSDRKPMAGKPMVKVVLWGSLKQALGDTHECAVEVEAGAIQDVLDRLGERYPQLRPVLDRGVAVSIDGVIYRQQRYRPIPPDSEVYILPKMAGG